MSCPYSAATDSEAPALRPELEKLPVRMRDLPLDHRGYPVPWFVEYLNGEPEFRAMDTKKWERAVNERLCWVCGSKLGSRLTFVLGPMCGINRTTSEPPCHHECAQWSARNCPFMARPHAVRRDGDEMGKVLKENVIGGIVIRRNPGVTLLWMTRSYEVYKDGRGGVLIQVGEPEGVEWWAESKLATRAQVVESIESGYPLLLETAVKQRGAVKALDGYKREFEALYPAA